MANCSFCGRGEESIDRLISGPDVYICDKCVKVCVGIMDKKPVPSLQNLPKPKEIKAHLDRFVIGQDLAKKAISIAVYNHYKRVKNLSREENSKNKVDYGKSNVLLLGPTGSGKTLLAKTLAAMLDVPFAIADATTLTEAGYVGEDVENVILRLLQAADFDVAMAEIGIIYLDEVDKLHTTKSNVSITRDVSGEGVQQALLKIVEGTVANIPPRGGRKHPNQEFIKVNTENILFIAGGAFVNLDRIIAKRIGKNTIGFGAETLTSHNDNHEFQALISKVEHEDLIQYGMIPEFIGRFNNIVHSNLLTKDELVQILVAPEGAILKQYVNLFADENIVLNVTNGALEAIAEKAMAVGTGARALRTIFENILRETMFSAPSDPTIEEVTIDRHHVENNSDPEIKYRQVTEN